jgi:hypothetical protein
MRSDKYEHSLPRFPLLEMGDVPMTEGVIWGRCLKGNGTINFLIDSCLFQGRVRPMSMGGANCPC